MGYRLESIRNIKPLIKIEHYPSTITAGILIILSIIFWLYPAITPPKYIVLIILLMAGIDTMITKRLLAFGLTVFLLGSALILQSLEGLYRSINPELAGISTGLTLIIRIVIITAVLVFVIIEHRKKRRNSSQS